jgi:hypothetical protein
MQILESACVHVYNTHAGLTSLPGPRHLPRFVCHVPTGVHLILARVYPVRLCLPNTMYLSSSTIEFFPKKKKIRQPPNMLENRCSFFFFFISFSRATVFGKRDTARKEVSNDVGFNKETL